MSENLQENLTSREFWFGYWQKKMDTGQIPLIDEPSLVTGPLINSISAAGANDIVEIGGFPGAFALQAKKRLHVQASIFDYVIHPDFLQTFLTANHFQQDSLHVIEGDIHSHVPEKKFDYVFSVGLVEHFENTSDIIEKHLRFCKDNGTIFIILPNFTGINGWLNKKFDPENYHIHNIKSMEPALLHQVAKQLKLENVRVFYFGKFSVWLENYAKLSGFRKLIFKTCWLMGKVFTRIVPIESRLLSPYIALEATKNGEA